MTYASKDDLLSEDQIGTEDVELPSGKVVKVRGLTLGEVRQLPPDDQTLGTLVLGLVEPKLTLDEARLWRERAPAGDPTAVIVVIQRLSGMDGGAAKAAYKSIRGEPESRVRSFSGGETRNDGNADASGDAA